MGVVAITLNEINAQLVKSHGEILARANEIKAKAEDAASRTYLDEDDVASLEAIRASAQALDDVVADAVTEPLPDPEPESGLDPAAPDVVDPEAPVEELPAVPEDVLPAQLPVIEE